MATNNHSLFVTCLSTTHKLLNKHVQLRTHFENSYREHLCNFNFEQYLSSNCSIPLSKMVEALKNACIDTRAHIGEMLEQGVDASLKESYLAIYHQIWTPFTSATLAQIAKAASPTKVVTSNKVSTPVAEVKVLPKAPKDKVSEICDGLWDLAESGEILYPKLCTKKFCMACCELLFDLPLSKCSVDCAHKKVTTLGVYPHLSRKFQDKLKPHHGRVQVKVKQVFKPNTYANPMCEVQPPESFDLTTTELEQGVERMEINSSTSAPASHRSDASSKQREAAPGKGTSVPVQSTSNWADTPEGSEYGGDQQPSLSPRPITPCKRSPSPTDMEEVARKVRTPLKAPVRRSPRNVRAQQQPY